MLRLGLIGCGRHAQTDHARPLKRYASEHPGEISLVAACDLKSELVEFFRKEFGFTRGYTNMQEMLDTEKLDGCVCVMPVSKIAETGIELLLRKIPCVIEKPPGASRDEAQRLARVARETGTPHMISVNRRFNPLVNKAIAWAREMGGIRYLCGTMTRSTRTEDDFVWGTGIHAVDAFRHIAGDVQNHRTTTHGGPSTSVKWHSVSFDFANGRRGQLDILPTAGLGQEVYELIGNEFVARVSIPFHTETSLRCWKEGKLVIEEVVSADQDPDLISGAYGEVVEFVGALKRGVSPRPTIHDMIPSADICFEVATMAS